MIIADPVPNAAERAGLPGFAKPAPGQGGSGRSDIFFAAVQMSRMPMCLADPGQPDTPLVFVNEAFLALSGYAEAEVLGRNCRFLQGHETDPADVQRLRDAIARREDVAVEIINYRRNGERFWNALYISPVFDPTGKLVYLFASQVDVTRRKDAEMLLQQSQRMEALGNLASGIAHEVNNLMTVIVGSAQQALKRAVDDRQRRQLQRVEWAGRQAGGLTQQVLSFARQQFHQTERSDLSQLVAGLDRLLAEVAGPLITVALELAPERLPVLVDAGQLQLALTSLVRNATDAMPQGGRLLLRTSMARAGSRAWAVLMVSDTGHGMTADIVRRAPDPFFTTKRSGAAGLGLSMVMGFVQQSGGHVAIQSEPGAGTQVELRLPLADHE